MCRRCDAVKKSLHELFTDAEQVENRVQPVVGLIFHLTAKAYVDHDALTQSSLNEAPSARAEL